MPFCKKCGNKLDEDAIFCPECGTPISTNKEQNRSKDTAISKNFNHTETNDYKTQIRQRPQTYGVLNLENLPIDHIIDKRYVIKAKIGQGGFGAIYRVFDKKMNIDKALKIIPEAITNDEEAMFDLQKESQTMIKLNHNNIVRVYDFHDTGTVKYIDMEYIDGKTLTKIKLEYPNKQVPEDIVKKYALQISEGLAYAHANNVIHKDIKPPNIMITADNMVKIMDFGIAETVRTSMSRLQNSSSSGTLVYMCPEQIKGKNIGKESDIYSFGAMLYELISGHPPFYKGDVNYQILNEEPEPLNNISSKMNFMIMKCLQKDYKERFRDFGEIKEYLEDTGKVKKNTPVAKKTFVPLQKNTLKKKKRKKNSFLKLTYNKNIYLALLWFGVSIGLAIILRNLLDNWDVEIFETDDYTGFLVGTLLSIAIGIIIIKKRWDQISKTELIIYWLGFGTELIILFGLIFDSYNTHILGIEDNTSGYIVGTIISIGCGLVVYYKKRKKSSFLTLIYNKNIYLALLWLGISIGLAIILRDLLDKWDVEILGSDDYTGFLVGALLSTVIGIIIIKKRWDQISKTELAIYWLGFCTELIFLFGLIFHEYDTHILGIEDNTSGYIVGIIISIGCGLFLYYKKRKLSSKPELHSKSSKNRTKIIMSTFVIIALIVASFFIYEKIGKEKKINNLLRLANYYFKDGNYDDAKREYQEILDNYGYNNFARKGLRKIKKAENDKREEEAKREEEEAQKEREEIIRQNNLSKHLTTAKEMYKNNNFENALNEYKSALEYAKEDSVNAINQKIDDCNKQIKYWNSALGKATKKILGKHPITLQWISWDYTGVVNIYKEGDEIKISGSQKGRGKYKDDYVKVSGTIEVISQKHLKLHGKVITKISHINGGNACVREGTFNFLATGSRQYWRMQEMQNPYDSATDYVDIYFSKM